MGFGGQFTKIKGLSERRRLPRLNKIRLGFKLKKGNKEYPAELPFFLLPDEVASCYGFKNKEEALQQAQDMGVTRKDVLTFIGQNAWRLAKKIEIMLPINDIGAVFPQAYKRYGSQRGVKCIGDGVVARSYDVAEGGGIDIECPCEHLKTDTNPGGDCSQRAHLLCLIPTVSMGGVYQIDVGSYNSIVDVNSGIEYIIALLGRFALVPMTLSRVPRETHHEGQKSTHFTLQLICDADVNTVNQLRADTQRIVAHQKFLLPPPDDTNPMLDTDGVVMEVDDESAAKAEVVSEPKVPSETAHDETVVEGAHFDSPDYFKKLIDGCDDLKALKEVWERIMKVGKRLNAKEISTLSKLKNSKKKKIKEAMVVDLDKAQKTMEETTSLEILDAVWAEVEPYLEGEDLVKMQMVRDRKATAIKDGGGEDCVTASI